MPLGRLRSCTRAASRRSCDARGERRRREARARRRRRAPARDRRRATSIERAEVGRRALRVAVARAAAGSVRDVGAVEHHACRACGSAGARTRGDRRRRSTPEPGVDDEPEALREHLDVVEIDRPRRPRARCVRVTAWPSLEPRERNIDPVASRSARRRQRVVRETAPSAPTIDARDDRAARGMRLVTRRRTLATRSPLCSEPDRAVHAPSRVECAVVRHAAVRAQRLGVGHARVQRMAGGVELAVEEVAEQVGVRILADGAASVAHRSSIVAVTAARPARAARMQPESASDVPVRYAAALERAAGVPRQPLRG